MRWPCEFSEEEDRLVVDAVLTLLGKPATTASNESVLNGLDMIEEAMRSLGYEKFARDRFIVVGSWKFEFTRLRLKSGQFEAYVESYRSVLQQILTELEKPTPGYSVICRLACRCTYDAREPFENPATLRECHLDERHCWIPSKPSPQASLEEPFDMERETHIKAEPSLRLLRMVRPDEPDDAELTKFVTGILYPDRRLSPETKSKPASSADLSVNDDSGPRDTGFLGISIDKSQHEIIRNEKTAKLAGRPVQFAVLMKLIESRGRFSDGERLATAARDGTSAESMKRHIMKLRRILSPLGLEIEAKDKVGWRLKEAGGNTSHDR